MYSRIVSGDFDESLSNASRSIFAIVVDAMVGFIVILSTGLMSICGFCTLHNSCRGLVVLRISYGKMPGARSEEFG